MVKSNKKLNLNFNKKAASTLGYVGGIIILLILIITVSSFINKGSNLFSNTLTSSSCSMKDYDGDGIINKIESINYNNKNPDLDKSCPCDSGSDSQVIVLNKKIWDSFQGTGPWTIFNFANKSQLEKVRTLPIQDFYFLMFYINNEQSKQQSRDFLTDYFGSLEEYKIKGVDLSKLSPATFCPKKCANKIHHTDDFSCCSKLEFKSEWFEKGPSSTPTNIELVFTCATPAQECEDKMIAKCKADKKAESSKKINLPTD